MRQTRRKRTLLNNEEDVGNDIDSKAGQHSQTTVLEVDPLELPEETAQGVWESLKEEFHACKQLLVILAGTLLKFVYKLSNNCLCHFTGRSR